MTSNGCCIRAKPDETAACGKAVKRNPFIIYQKIIPTFVKNSSQLPHSHKLTTVSIIRFAISLTADYDAFHLYSIRVSSFYSGIIRGILFQTAFVLKPNPTLLVFN
jgi:hypothetical protein